MLIATAVPTGVVVLVGAVFLASCVEMVEAPRSIGITSA